MAGILDLDDGLDPIDPIENVPKDKEFDTKDETNISILYNKETPLNSILQSLSGYRWTVNYYNQLRDMNDTLMQLDITASSTIQKYNKIKNMLFFVQTPLSQGDAKSLNGEALIRGDFLPNVHDVFIAALPGGRKAIFTVTNVEDRTSNLNKVYAISYGILHYIDSKNDSYLKSLEHKVMKTYVYDNKHLATHSSPLVLEKTYKDKINIEDNYRELVRYYANRFMNPRGVIALPTKDKTVYTDPYLIDFFFKTINSSDFLELSRVTRLPFNKTKIQPFTVFDAILNKRKKDLIRVDTNLGYRSNGMYIAESTIYHQYYRLGINYIMSVLEEGEIGESIPELEDYSTYDKYYTDEEDRLDIDDLTEQEEEETEDEFHTNYPTQPEPGVPPESNEFPPIPDVDEDEDEEEEPEYTPTPPPVVDKPNNEPLKPTDPLPGNRPPTKVEDIFQDLVNKGEAENEQAPVAPSKPPILDLDEDDDEDKSKIEQIYEELKKQEELENANKPKPEPTKPSISVESTLPPKQEGLVKPEPVKPLDQMTPIEKKMYELQLKEYEDKLAELEASQPVQPEPEQPKEEPKPEETKPEEPKKPTKIEEIYQQLLEKENNGTNGSTSGTVQPDFPFDVPYPLDKPSTPEIDLEEDDDELEGDEEVEDEEITEEEDVETPTPPKKDIEVETELEYENPILDPVRSYIFSKNFYKDERTKCGLVERLLLDYLEDNAIDDTEIFKISTQYHMWTTEEQYNLIPFVLFLIKYHLSTIDKG